MFAYWATLGRSPYGALDDGPALLRFTTGVANPFLNGVMHARLLPEDIDAAIETNRAYFASRGVPALWWISPTTQPPQLAQHLMQHALPSAGQFPMMALDLTTLPDEPEALPAGFMLAPVDDEHTLRAWSAIISACFDFPLSGSPTFFDLEASLGSAMTSTRYRLIGYHDSTPVATACLMPGAGVAGLYTIAVLPEARQHGFGTAITVAVVHEARRQGYRIATLQASPMGRPVYRRLGFQEVAMLDCYLYPHDQEQV